MEAKTGVIINENNYTYEGEIHNGIEHGYGTFIYSNGDKYIGEILFGKLDGYGIYYYKSGAKYTGFFSYNRRHGIGTFEDENNIYKGQWRNDKKHGMFFRTKKNCEITFEQKWYNGNQVSSNKVSYIQPSALITHKSNPKNKPKKYQITYKGVEKKCIGCYDKPTNSTNTACGHVAMCYDCLKKCDKCPICRCEIKFILKLFVS